MVSRPCIQCGEVTASTRCASCAAAHERTGRGDFRARYGGNRWDVLSKRARRLQPWCSDCGATERLQCDHLPSAWARLEARKVVRLRDVDVVCGPCNSRRGSSRPGSERAKTQGAYPPGVPTRAAGEAKFRSQSGSRS